MSERILIGVAWPYANGHLHMGHVAGCYLPADIFARYHRLKGNEVLMVSGSDQHGTPITLKAEEDGTTPQEVVKTFHQSFVNCWDRLGITFDLFTTTETDNHQATVHDIFLKLLHDGHIYKNTMNVPYCEKCKRHLADRYVEGACPNCDNHNARGDQCDRCGKPMDPQDLLEPRCRICGSTIHIRESEHFFLKLSAFQDHLLKWVTQQNHWRPNVLNFTRNFVADGLKDRAITRDIEWGVPVPLDGYDKKRIYVWFEAVIGYLSASKEWAERQGEPEKWRQFWEDPQTRCYYFIGKDNIPFHTIIWPAILTGYGALNLPYDVPANEFLTLEGQQLSTSRNWAVWLPDYLEQFDPDPLRYFLSANMPESADTDFSWREFVRRNNDELVATYGNLVHRVLSLTYNNFQGMVPVPGPLADRDHQVLQEADAAFKVVEQSLEACRFRNALKAIMSLSQKANRYLDAKEPWKQVKTDKSAAATTLWAALAVLSWLSTMTYPFLPFTAARLHAMLGFPGTVEQAGWTPRRPTPGQVLQPPVALFTKLEDEVTDQEVERGGISA